MYSYLRFVLHCSFRCNTWISHRRLLIRCYLNVQILSRGPKYDVNRWVCVCVCVSERLTLAQEWKPFLFFFVTDVNGVLPPGRCWQSPDELGHRHPTGSAEKPQRPTVSRGDRGGCYSNGFGLWTSKACCCFCPPDTKWPMILQEKQEKYEKSLF